MSEANKQLVQRWFEVVWNQRSETGIDAILSPECRAHGLSGADSPLIGSEGFKKFHRNFCRAFPDLKVEVQDTIAEYDKVAARWTTTMTHLGDGLGFPASGKRRPWKAQPSSSSRMAGLRKAGTTWISVASLPSSRRLRAVSQFPCTFRHFQGWLFPDEKATRQFQLRCKAIVKPL